VTLQLAAQRPYAERDEVRADRPKQATVHQVGGEEFVQALPLHFIERPHVPECKSMHPRVERGARHTRLSEAEDEKPGFGDVPSHEKTWFQLVPNNPRTAVSP
jgi:hypothetical protein